MYIKDELLKFIEYGFLKVATQGPCMVTAFPVIDVILFLEG